LLATTARFPGYGIDHGKARKEGGADEHWQTGKEAKAEDG
jgi:hypothetical protein